MKSPLFLDLKSRICDISDAARRIVCYLMYIYNCTHISHLMNVIPLAFDSMGVRSMCCFVEGEKTILIDPGVSLAPRRFGLPPHQLELEELMKKRQKIQEYAKRTDIVTISHWHNDHHTPFITGLYNSVTPDLAKSLYQEKTVLAKSLSGLNFMQRKRAHSFQNHCSFAPCDGKTFSFDSMIVKFSSPVSHGTLERIHVVMVSIESSKKIVHASDIQGFSGIDYIKEESPDILIMSGPPTYLLDTRDIQKAESNILEVMDYCDELILDHHLVRDSGFKEALPEVWKSKKVKTAAEYKGFPNALLEARRKELFKELP